MTQTSRWYVEFRDYYAVVGHNPESADMSNPNGEIISTRYMIIATDYHGNRRQLESGFVSIEEAEQYYLLFAPPVELWDETQPAYGSLSYANDWSYYAMLDELRDGRDMDSLIRFYPGF